MLVKNATQSKILSDIEIISEYEGRIKAIVLYHR